jgi:hypothetical protein
LDNLTGRYVGIEILDNGGDSSRVGFQEIGITAVPEPSAFALIGLGGLALFVRRRRS